MTVPVMNQRLAAKLPSSSGFAGAADHDRDGHATLKMPMSRLI